MPTNEERRQVAAQLREASRGYGSDAAFWGLAMEYDAESLADLIEPEPERTCHFEKIVDKEPLDMEFRTNPVIYYVCSECGVECAEPSRYCHNCGAKVVN